jgi:hypothetical protein
MGESSIGRSVSRIQQPALFWAIILLQLVVGAIFLAAAMIAFFGGAKS